MVLIFVATVLVGSLLAWLSECIAAMVGDAKGVARAMTSAFITKVE